MEESTMVDEAVLETVPELRPHQWNRLQEKVWAYLITKQPGDAQRWQAARALIKRDFWNCDNTFEDCKRILDEYADWIEANNTGDVGEGEQFCEDGINRFMFNMRSRNRRDDEARERMAERRRLMLQNRMTEAVREFVAEPVPAGRHPLDMPYGVCADWRRCVNPTCVAYRESRPPGSF